MTYHISTANGMYLGKRTDDPDPELDSEFPLRGVYFVADIKRAELYPSFTAAELAYNRLNACFSEGFLRIVISGPLVQLWTDETNAIIKNEAHMAAVSGLSEEQFMTMIYGTTDDD